MKSLLASAAALFLIVSPAVAKDLEGAGASRSYLDRGLYRHPRWIWPRESKRLFRFGGRGVGLTLCGTAARLIRAAGHLNPFVFDYGQSGGLFGLQVGYNWQAAQNLILGVEVSGSATSVSGWLNDSALGGLGRWDNILMATAKVGVTKGNWLLYGEGGYAVANAAFEGDLGCDFMMQHSGPGRRWRAIGVKLSQRVSLDLKYDHIWAGCQTEQLQPVQLL